MSTEAQITGNHTRGIAIACPIFAPPPSGSTKFLLQRSPIKFFTATDYTETTRKMDYERMPIGRAAAIWASSANQRLSYVRRSSRDAAGARVQYFGDSGLMRKTCCPHAIPNSLGVIPADSKSACTSIGMGLRQADSSRGIVESSYGLSNVIFTFSQKA